MYSVCALVAAACLLALTAHADEDNFIEKEAGRLPANYNKFVKLPLAYGIKACDTRFNILELFELGPRKPVAVSLAIEYPESPIRSPKLEISKDLLTGRVIRYPPHLLRDCLEDVLYVAIEVN